ncbi:MAG: hypothetical protein IPP72_10145 [Chitinophagaceae bacterium]|nr:hypothetical protein [Chitinophagaceae bacterium]
MRKYLALTCFILFYSLAHAQYVTIPDNDFRNFLLSKYPGCFNIAQELNTSCTAITTEDSLEFHGIGSSFHYPAMNIEGIQYFSSLVYLNCSNTKISFSPALPASLKHLDFSGTSTGPAEGFLPGLPSGLQRLVCTDNYFYSLPGLPAALKYLNCSNNILSSLGTLPGSIDTLICKNQLGDPVTHVLRSLPVLPAGLRYLDCSQNGLDSISGLPANLHYLDCSNQYVNTNPEAYRRTLSTLRTLPPGLLYLNCSDNCLTALPALPAQLQYLNCASQYNLQYISSNSFVPDKTLAALPALPASLLYLNCSNNFLSGLPNLPGALKYLDCSSQYIYISSFPPPPDPYNYTMNSLPGLPNSLTALYCNFNMITCMPHLPGSLDTLLYDTEKIPCIPNACTAAPNAAVCNPVNDFNQCLPYPVISGIVFTDINNNGVKDINEFPRKNIRVSLSNGAFTFSDNSGHFLLKADSIGTYSLSVAPPAYYTAAPATAVFNFSRYDTAVTKSFALQAAATKDSLSVKIIPVNSTARPGFSFPYTIIYENAGTTTLAPSLSFQYDNTRLTG